MAVFEWEESKPSPLLLTPVFAVRKAGPHGLMTVLDARATRPATVNWFAAWSTTTLGHTTLTGLGSSTGMSFGVRISGSCDFKSRLGIGVSAAAPHERKLVPRDGVWTGLNLD